MNGVAFASTHVMANDKPTRTVPPTPARSSGPSETKPTPVDPDDDREERTGGDEREGATEKHVGDRTGPAAGYDEEPQQDEDPGGVAPS